MIEPLHHTEAAIRALGPNDEERGKKLGVSGRTIRRWLNQRRYPDGWAFLKQNPILAESFCKDIHPAVPPHNEGEFARLNFSADAQPAEQAN